GGGARAAPSGRRRGVDPPRRPAPGGRAPHRAAPLVPRAVDQHDGAPPRQHARRGARSRPERAQGDSEDAIVQLVGRRPRVDDGTADERGTELVPQPSEVTGVAETDRSRRLDLDRHDAAPRQLSNEVDLMPAAIGTEVVEPYPLAR